jgi:threonine dehydrogenase-like Zn-dependent dehydrogenase
MIFRETSRRQFITTVAAASGAISTQALSAVENNSSITFQEVVRNVPLNTDADVIVCGAGPVGVTAAISAAGVTAAVAAKSKVAPHDVPWSEVQPEIAKIRVQS